MDKDWCYMDGQGLVVHGWTRNEGVWMDKDWSYSFPNSPPILQASHLTPLSHIVFPNSPLVPYSLPQFTPCPIASQIHPLSYRASHLILASFSRLNSSQHPTARAFQVHPLSNRLQLTRLVLTSRDLGPGSGDSSVVRAPDS